MSYNPSATATIGLEFDAYSDGVTALSSPSVCAAFWVDSSATETIDEIYIPHTWTGPSTGYGKLCVDVYNLADTGAGATLTETRYQPNQDTTVSNMFGTSPAWTSLSAGSCYTKIDETSYSDSDYLNFTWTGKDRMAFNTAAMSASLQVASVKFEVRAFGYWGTTGSLDVDLYNNTTYVSTLGTITPPADSDDTHLNFRTYTVGPFTTNPLTGVAWTATDIINMDSGTNLLVQLTSSSGNVAVSWLSMIVTTGADKRVATGTTATQTSLPSGTQTALPVTLSANWSKASGTDYLLVCRRIDDPTGLATTLIPQPMWIGTGTNPHVHGQSYSTTLDSSGLLSATGSVDVTKTYGFWLYRTDNNVSVDSQPYYDVSLQQCHTSSTLKQGVAGAAATIYKGVQLLVASPSTTPGADLLVKLKRTSDNVQMGGTATVTAASITSGTLLGTHSDATLGSVSIYRLNVNLASTATLATATDYYFEYTSTAASTAPWYVVELVGTSALTGNQTYGGSTDQATIAGSGVAAGDFVTRISTTLTAPSSVTWSAASPATINGTTVYYADVDWVDGGAIGATFDYWEVARSEDGGTTYTTIAYVETEATVTFADYEVARGVSLYYRVRKVRTDGAVSDWTVDGGIGSTIPAANQTKTVVFVSNAAPTLSVGYSVLGPEANYGFLNADETVFMRLHNRDYQAAFKPLESRGMSWSFDLLVHASKVAPSAGKGVQAFGALRDLAESTDVTYICMHTADAERFFGVIQVAGGRRVEPNGAYIARVTFTETQATSSVVTV